MAFFADLYPVLKIEDTPHVPFLAHADVARETQLDEFLVGVKALAAVTDPFFLTTNELEFFGTDEDIPVITLVEWRSSTSS